MLEKKRRIVLNPRAPRGKGLKCAENREKMAETTLNFDFYKRLDALEGVRILCVGDIMLDRFVYGTVDRISPESPVPVLRMERENAMLGGAGNAVANLAALETRPCVVGLIGEDDSGKIVKAKLQDMAADDAGLVVDAKRVTTVKRRFLSSNQHMLRVDQEQTHPLSSEIEKAVLKALEILVPKSTAVILSDYGKAVLNDTIVEKAIGLGRAHNIPVLVDPKGRDFSRYKGASVITPNKKELADAAGLPAGTDEEIIAAANKIIETCGIDAVVATRSAEGMSIIRRGEKPVHLPTRAREVYDVSGAGDTVISTIAAALGSGADLVEAAALSNIAAGLAVEKVGTSIVRAQEIRDALRQEEKLAQLEHGQGHAYLLDRQGAVEQAERWRAKKFKIGFTNGCFDILHPGHISLLRQARARCDRLIVGLNTDASVRRLKGDARPVNDEQARALVLAAIAHVDMVVLFDEDTPIGLIKDISPDVLVKGADYTIETVVGAEHVLSYGGEVFLAELTDGFSTTGMIEKLAAGGK